MRSLIVTMLVMVASQPAAAQHIISQATFTPGAASEPELAVSNGHYTGLAYRLQLDGDPRPQVAVQFLPSDPHTDELWPDPRVFGPGTHHKICWSHLGFTLALARDDTVWTYQADHAGNWDLDNPGIYVPGGAIHGLDMWGQAVEAPGGPTVFFIIVDGLGPMGMADHRIHYGQRSTYSGWSSLTLVIEGLPYPPHAQVSWMSGPIGPWPMIYFLQETNELVEMFSTHMTEQGWSQPWRVPISPAGIPSPIAGEFDVARVAFDTGIIGLGPQPTCPCGSVHFVAYHGDGGGWQWQPSQDITVPHSYYDWPWSPRIDVDSSRGMHLFWLQLAAGEDMMPLARHLEYRIYRAGEWTDSGDFLDVPELKRGIGDRVDIGISRLDGRSVLAWSRTDTIAGTPLAETIFVARSSELSSAPTAAPLRPQIELAAWPNPFNPRVNLAVTVNRTGPLHLDIVDARGRRVLRLHDGTLQPGRHVFSWDGRQPDGRRAPSGVFFAVAAGEAGRTVHKVVLAE